MEDDIEMEAATTAFAMAEWFIRQDPENEAAPKLERVADYFESEIERLKKSLYNAKRRRK